MALLPVLKYSSRLPALPQPVTRAWRNLPAPAQTGVVVAGALLAVVAVWSVLPYVLVGALVYWVGRRVHARLTR